MRSLSLFVVLVVLVFSGVFASVGGAADAPFTLQAEAGLRPALTALHEALYDGKTPVFVDANADLLATGDPETAAKSFDGLPAHFLPGAMLIPASDNAEAARFIAFAISPEGQQALIDKGFLPAVVRVTDQAGQTVEIRQPVRSAVSPYSVATYYVYSVGASDRLLAAGFLGARDPQGAAIMERIDPRFPQINSETMTQRDMSVEELANLKPDVILTSARSAWLGAVAELGIPVVLYEGESPERLREAMRLTGQIFGPNAAARAEAWIAYYDWIFRHVVDRTAVLEPAARPKVLFTGTEPLRVASGEMYQTAIIEAAGGISASAELKGFWNDVNLEQVLLWNPDVILVPPYGGASVELITGNAEWQALDAVKAGRVYRVPKLTAPWDTPVPDSALGIVWAARKLFPELVEFDCRAEVAKFYRDFYNYAISDDEITELALCE